MLNLNVLTHSLSEKNNFEIARLFVIFYVNEMLCLWRSLSPQRQCLCAGAGFALACAVSRCGGMLLLPLKAAPWLHQVTSECDAILQLTLLALMRIFFFFFSAVELTET